MVTGQLVKPHHAPLPHKQALSGAAVGLLIPLGQHIRLGTQVADTGRKRFAQGVFYPALHGLYRGFDLRIGDFFLTAEQCDHGTGFVQNEQPVQVVCRNGLGLFQNAPPQCRAVAVFIAAVAAQREHYHNRVVHIDPLVGQHRLKTLGIMGRGGAAQHGAQPNLEMPLHTLADFCIAQPLMVKRIL